MTTRKQLQCGHKNLSYNVRGNGPAVMLVHGFGEDGSVWENQMEAFPNNKLIIPYLPGCGESEMIEAMSMDGLAAALKEIIYTELSGGEKCILIGHSMGGYITLAFVEKYLGLVSGFGLFHSSAYADSEEKIATRKKGIEFIKSNGAAAFLKTSIPNLYAPKTKTQMPWLIEQHIKASERFMDAALISYYESMMQRPDRTHILKNTQLPVLFILGRHDTAVPLQDGLQQAHMPELSYIHILEDSGHMGMIEEIKESNRLLQNFINHF